MSADKLTENVRIYSYGEYNFYTITAESKTYLVGGVPENMSNEYAEIAKNADGIIVLTSKPEFCGGLDAAISVNPDIEIFATPAGLRNVREIVNCDINERLIKNTTEFSGIKFAIIPGVHWVDTAAAIFDGILFSGEMFSGGEAFREYYKNRLSVNSGFVHSAAERLQSEDIRLICPSYGSVQRDVEFIFEEYMSMSAPRERAERSVCIVYSSEYGFTKSVAEYIYTRLSENAKSVLINADDADMERLVQTVNSSDVLIIGTRTVNRNAPQSIWNVITGLDLVNKRGMPYFVFGSFGWAADGIKLTDKTLSAMGMRQIVKPVEMLLKPSSEDFDRIEKAVNKIIEYDDFAD